MSPWTVARSIKLKKIKGRRIAPLDSCQVNKIEKEKKICPPHVAGAWTERKKMFHGGSFLKLADDDV